MTPLIHTEITLETVCLHDRWSIDPTDGRGDPSRGPRRAVRAARPAHSRPPAVGLLAALLLVACGSDSDPAQIETQTDGTDTAGTAGASGRPTTAADTDIVEDTEDTGGSSGSAETGETEPSMQIFALEYDARVGDFRYQGERTPHPGGGYYVLSGNGGVEPNNTNLAIVDIDDDPLYPTVQKAYRNTYYADGSGQPYANHVLFINIPTTPKFYLRTRVRFSDNWMFGDDQLKFTKNRGSGPDRVSTNTWFDANGYFCATFDGGLGQVYLFADWWGDPDNPTRTEDDINNGFGPGGSDANWTPTNGQWHWLEWEIDAQGPGSADGRYQMWVDGELYISKAGIQISASMVDDMFNSLEFGGHVWQDGLPSEDIYLDIHKVDIFPERPGPPPGL